MINQEHDEHHEHEPGRGQHGHDHDHPTGFRGALREFFRPHSHDAADSVDTALATSTEGIRAVKISLVALLVTALAQAVVVLLTGSGIGFAGTSSSPATGSGSAATSAQPPWSATSPRPHRRFHSLAVVGGAAGVLLGFPLPDPIVGLLITVAILGVLRGAATDIYRRLMDAVDPEVTDQAASTLRETDGALGVEYLRLRWIGHHRIEHHGTLR